MGCYRASLGSPNQANQSFSLGNDIKLTAYFAPEGLVNLSLVSEPDGAASYLLEQVPLSTIPTMLF